jgi:hypothetical protein
MSEGSKPRVFLSHSRSDQGFIHKVEQDLRRCQIDPWLDTAEIRHGQPWLEAIFKTGIPTCDGILVYLTEESIGSSMVKKELDAGLIQKLKDKHVALLPYVSAAGLRAHLRADLQTLQIPEWNDANYVELLPVVVAEVWRSYFDRNLVAATNEERVRRLEAELALEKLRTAADANIFGSAEEKDFAYILAALNRDSSATAYFYNTGSQDEREIPCTVNLLALLLLFLSKGYQIYQYSDVEHLLRQALVEQIGGNAPAGWQYLVKDSPDIGPELRMFGLLRQTLAQKPEVPAAMAKFGNNLLDTTFTGQGLDWV